MSFHAGAAVASAMVLPLLHVLEQRDHEQDGGGQEQEERNNQCNYLTQYGKIQMECLKSPNRSAVCREMLHDD